MTTQIRLTTTGLSNPVIIADLGAVSFPHPTTSFVLNDSSLDKSEFSLDELKKSNDLQIAIDNGDITIDNENSVAIEILKDYINGNINFNSIEVDINPSANKFTSIYDALQSISGSTATNRFIIKIVGAGEYIEPELDFSTKPYVSLVGTSIQTTVIKPIGNHHIIKLGELNEVSFLWLEDAPSGYAGLAIINGGNYSQAHKVTFNNCDIGIKVSAFTADTYFYGEYIDFNGLYSFGVQVLSSAGFQAYTNVENVYNLPEGGTPICYLISGSAAKLDALAGGNKQLGAQGGTGISVEDGGFVDISATYFQNLTTAISLPNTGAATIAQFSNVSLFDNATDISVAHVAAQGNFQGQCNTPTISVVSTATFGISYLERLLGNKQEVYYDPYNIAPSAVTSPTAAAATTVVQSSVTGLIALQFSGTANQNGNLNMRIPKDYLSGGRFKISWSTSSTSANNIVFAPIISVKSVGDSLITQTETLTPQTITAGTINLRQETAFFTPTTTFSVGQLVVLRITRPASSNAADTFTGAIYVNGVIFEYNSSK